MGGAQIGVDVAEDGADQTVVALVDPQFNLSLLERETILKALAHSKGNQLQTAALCGISVRTLSRKLRSYGMPARRRRKQ